MPYYGYGTPVQGALRDTSSILGQGLRDIGQGRLRREDLGLKRALQERQMQREGVADTRAAETYAAQRPGMQLKQQEDEEKLRTLNSPVKLAALANGDLYSLQFWVNRAKDAKQSPSEDFAELFEAKWDTNEKSPTRGMLIKADGTPVLNKEVEAKGDIVAATLATSIDPKHVFNDQLSRLNDKITENPELLKGQYAQQIATNVRNTVSWLEKPEQQVKTYEQLRNLLSKFSGPKFEKAIARLDKQIDGLKATATKQAETAETRGWEREKLGIQHKNALELEGVKERNKDKELKMDPRDKAVITTMQDEMKSNETRITELTKMQFDVGPPEQKAAIAQEKAELKKRNKELRDEIRDFGKPKVEPRRNPQQVQDRLNRIVNLIKKAPEDPEVKQLAEVFLAENPDMSQALVDALNAAQIKDQNHKPGERQLHLKQEQFMGNDIDATSGEFGLKKSYDPRMLESNVNPREEINVLEEIEKRRRRFKKSPEEFMRGR